jgi:hypothetical protein
VPTPKLAVAADVVRAAEVQRGMAQVRADPVARRVDPEVV